jgi:hypothetical protein
MAKDINAINLLPNKGNGFLNQFLTWLLNIGRLLIILTEMLALGTFIYRFSLDRDIIDNHDEIKRESAIVQNFQQEDTFRNLQQRISLAKKYDLQSNQISTIFREIAEMGRGKITFKNLIVSTDTVKIEAQAPTANALTLFVSALKNSPDISSITIDTVENKTSSAQVNVGITANIQTFQAAKSSQQTVQVLPEQMP